MSPTGRLWPPYIDHPKELLPGKVSLSTFVGVDAWSVFSWLQYSSGDNLKGGRWEHGLLSVIGCRPVFCSGSF